MYIVVRCSCGQEMSAEVRFAGQSVQCIQCSKLVPVPEPSTPTASEAAEISGAATLNVTSDQMAALDVDAPTMHATSDEIAAATGSHGSIEETEARQAAAQGDGVETVQAPVPQVEVAPKPGKGRHRKTFVSDWAKDMAEQWAEDHQDHIAPESRPSRIIPTLAGILTIVIYVPAAYIFVPTFSVMVLGVGTGGIQLDATGSLAMAAVTISATASVFGIIAGAFAIMARPAAVGACAAFHFLSILGYLYVGVALVGGGRRGAAFFIFLAGMGFTFVTLMVCVWGIRKAYRYQLWKAREATDG